MPTGSVATATIITTTTTTTALKRSKQVAVHLVGHVTRNLETVTVSECGMFVTVYGTVPEELMKRAVTTRVPCGRFGFKCGSLSFCIPIWRACDGYTHCPNGADESGCPVIRKTCKAW